MELADALALLRGAGGPRPFAGAAMALPAPPVLRAVQGTGSGAAPPLALGTLLSLTEGLPAELEAPLAELLSMRGLRAEGGAAFPDPSAAHAAATAALRAAAVRCPRALCAAAAPLPIPLSYPRILHQRPPGAPSASASAARPPNPEAAPALARLSAGADFAPLLRATAADFCRLAGGAVGRAAMASWGYSALDADEAAESLRAQAAAYTSDDDDDDNEDGEDA